MAQYQFDINAAMKAGYTPDQIQEYLTQQQQAGNSYQLAPQPQATPQQSQQPVKSPDSNPFDIRNYFSTIGAVGLPLAADVLTGGVAIPFDMALAGAGGALGEGASELTKGEKLNPGKILAQGALGGVGEGAGQLIGKGVGAILNRAGSAMTDQAANLTGQVTAKNFPKIVDSVLPDSNQYFTKMEGLQQAAENAGAVGKPVEGAMSAVNKRIGDLDKAIKSSPDFQKDFNVNQALQDFNDYVKEKGLDLPTSNIDPDTLDAARETIKQLGTKTPTATPADQAASTAYNNAAAKVKSLQSQVDNLTKNMEDISTTGSTANGRMSERDLANLDTLRSDTMQKLQQAQETLKGLHDPLAPKVPTVADAYKLKSQLADLTLNNAFIKQTGQRALTPNEEANMALFNSIKDSIDNQTGTDFQGMNQEQNRLMVLGKALAKANPKLSNPAAFSLKDILGVGAAGVAGGPLGLGLGVAGELAARNPELMAAGARLANGAGRLAVKTGGSVGAAVPTLGGSLLPSSPNANQETQNQNTNNINQNMLPPTPDYNSTVSGNQPLPTLNGQPSYATGTASQAQNPLAGYKINGQPIDPATANLVYKIATYQLDPTKLSSLYKSGDRERLINLASQFNPNYDMAEFPVKQKIRNDFTSGTDGQNIKALNTVIGHLYTLSQMSDALGNSSFTPYNTAKNALGTTMGSPNVTNFNTTASAVAGEAAKVFKSSGATDTEISQFTKGLNPNMSPAQLKGNINTMILLMISRLNALQDQYQQGLGQPPDSSFISPESQAILQKLQGQLPATP